MGKQVQDVMTANPVTVSRTDTVIAAARLMESADVGSVPVVDGGTPVGIVTDRDIVVKVVAAGKDPAKAQVGSIIRRSPAVVREDQGILDATRMLSRRGVRRLPVVGKGGKLVGIVSLDDILMLLGSEMGHIASALASELGRAKI